ncbi:MAG: hypothetical protein MRZ79_06745 [Bacteroidia bacterium]|nr:hypothetical protein [Bacteroidia bacterium]
MRLKLNRPVSQLILIAYIAITFGFRFVYEVQLTSHYWLSLVTGVIFLSLPYALIKVGFLNPGWFWFEKEFKEESSEAKA